MHSSYNQIDENVILTMIMASVIAFVALAFRYTNYEPCTPAAITINPTIPYVNNLVMFTANEKGSGNKKLVWDFGDGSRKEENGIIVMHTYKKTGPFTVTLTINYNCPTYFTV